MTQYRQIVLIADRELRHTPAFESARALARASGAALHLAVIDYSASIAALGILDREAMQRARAGLLAELRRKADAEAEALSAQGIAATASVSWAHPAIEAIVELVSERRADLVIKDVQLDSPLRRLLYTPLDWELLRQCPAPLLLVAEQGVALPRRILAAVDPLTGNRALDDAIVASALELALQTDAELHLATVSDAYFELVTQSTPYAPIASEAAFEIVDTERRQAFERFADDHGVPAERRHYLHGLAASTLVALMHSATMDAMVIGAGAHSGIEHLMMGSTAKQILRHVHGSVLVVRMPASNVIEFESARRERDARRNSA